MNSARAAARAPTRVHEFAVTLLKAFALFAVYTVVLAITMADVFLYAVLQL